MNKITAMNERIKELAEQAELYALDKQNEGDDEDYECSFDDDFLEKFSELIVKECLLKANGAKIRGETIDELIERIKDDFGVE